MLVGVELAVAGGGYLNHDVAWFCYMSQRWGDGARLYVDVVDTNPPLIVFLSTPPILLAKALSWPVDVTMLAYVSALAIASVAVCGMLVVRAWPDADPLQRGLFMTGIVAVVFPLSGTDFAQREHLALIFALPYVLAAAVRLSGLALPWPAAMAIGFMGGLGLAIKPHLLAIAVIVEGTMVALRRCPTDDAARGARHDIGARRVRIAGARGVLRVRRDRQECRRGLSGVE